MDFSQDSPNFTAILCLDQWEVSPIIRNISYKMEAATSSPEIVPSEPGGQQTVKLGFF